MKRWVTEMYNDLSKKHPNMGQGFIIAYKRGLVTDSEFLEMIAREIKRVDDERRGISTD